VLLGMDNDLLEIHYLSDSQPLELVQAKPILVPILIGVSVADR